jgi:hypothetical protein
MYILSAIQLNVESARLINPKPQNSSQSHEVVNEMESVLVIGLF